MENLQCQLPVASPFLNHTSLWTNVGLWPGLAEGENGVQVQYPLMHGLGQGQEILLSGTQGSFKCCSPPPRTLEQPCRKGASTKSWRLDFLLNLEGGVGRDLMGLRRKWRKQLVFPHEYRANLCRYIILFPFRFQIIFTDGENKGRESRLGISGFTKLSFAIRPPAQPSFKASGL